MPRGLLMLLLALSLFIMGSSLYLMWQRVQKNLLQQPPKDELSLSPEQSFGPAQNIQSLPQRAQPLKENVLKHESASVATADVQKNEKTQEAKRSSPRGERVEQTSTNTVPSKKVAKTRKVFFQYRDSVPKKVSIIGDFNQWVPQLMSKGTAHLWTISMDLPTGEYAYNFIVDGRIIRDPNNKKNRQANQKIPSSILVVKTK